MRGRTSGWILRGLGVGALGAAMALTMVGSAIGQPLSAPAVNARPAAQLAPLLGTASPGVLPARYIVVFRPGSSADQVQSALDGARHEGAQVHERYSHALQGFAATLPAATLTQLRSDPEVQYVEADATVTATAEPPPTVKTEANAPQGLDRIDQRDLPLDSMYDYAYTGAGVTAYVIDTGIRTTHQEFDNRATWGANFTGDGINTDCQGHGTHVAGIIGGSTYGVAKRVHLVAVKVLGCSGSGPVSNVIAGVDWVTANHKGGQHAVANMSLGGSPSPALDTAVSNSINDGIVYTVAAGNSAADACSFSPGDVPAALTVGADDSTGSTDTVASFSNVGPCVDLFAPGVNITSAYDTSDTATATLSGTSMSAPFVAGTAALFWQSDSSATASSVAGAVEAEATPGVISGSLGGAPNLLVYTAP
jgi:subtilisin family serine protease